MAKSEKTKIEILADGVFIAEDVRKDKGDIAEGVEPAVAEKLIKAGLAK